MPTTQKALRLDAAISSKTTASWSKHQQEDSDGAEAKRKSTKRVKPVRYGSFVPGMAVAVRHEISEWPNGAVKVVWVKGYEVHDPEAPNASKLKHRKGQLGWVPIVRTGEHESRACFRVPTQIEAIQPDKQYREFGDCYLQSRDAAVLGNVEVGEVVELNDRENEALIQESIVRESL